VAEKKDFPGGVLIRAIEHGDRKIIGPGKLTKFLHIDKSLNNHDLTVGKKLWIESRDARFRASNKRRFKIKRSPRVGIDYARHCKSWQWNFRILD
ncbi:MAG TPA: DNA-3-methyladenine glycosylase, partial [Patescibacteria group bacterium]|nr:DNA-3-methyladenine glycosylase [Patescibacteria group bacterium]